MTKSKILVKSKNHDFISNSRNKKVKTGFFTLKARLMFTQLRKAFLKALIFHYFNPECHIRNKTDASGYTIDGILSQLILNDLS